MTNNPLDRADLALWESRNARLPERHRRDPEPEDLAKMRLDVVAVLQAIREPPAVKQQIYIDRRQPGDWPPY